MAKVTFIQPDGSSRNIEIHNGLSVMEGATANDIPGIVAECGGGCVCSTCHCYVAPEWYDRLPPAQGEESGLIEFAWEPRQTSRLSCQLQVTDAMDGLVLEVPAQQI